ncbi:MAG: glycosyltransferase family 1 protein [Candidatus Saccharimonadales bacterium]
MKHIVIDARIINSSTGTYVERLLTYLQEVDTVNKYTVLVPKKDVNFWQPTASNFSIVAADFKNYSLSEQIGLKKLLDKLAPDLVHFCMPQQPILYTGKHVTTFHDLTLLRTYNSDKNWLAYHFKQLVGKYVFKAALKNSSHVLTPSNYTKSELLKFTNILPDKITVTHLSADTSIEEIKPYKPLLYDEYILYVGQQSDYKNIRRLGEAHQKLIANHPNLGLILVGKLNASALINKRYFAENNFNNIVFTDFIPNSRRDWLYKNTRAYVFPSLMEGFGLPGLEAMGYGAPVISSDATCLPEVYGDAAYYFNPLETSDIARAINDVLTDEELRKSLINKGRDKIKEYSWLRTAQETHRVYLAALNGK